VSQSFQTEEKIIELPRGKADKFEVDNGSYNNVISYFFCRQIILIEKCFFKLSRCPKNDSMVIMLSIYFVGEFY